MSRFILTRILLALAMITCVMVLPSYAQQAEEGTLEGLLVKKGATWIEVKADGEKEAKRYIPCWRGGMPDQGGGLDKAMLETIAKLVVPNRVKLGWKMEEHLRVISVEVIIPEEKIGTLTGVVSAVNKEWLEVTSATGLAQRYFPRWIGGMPKDGGGLDRDMLTAIAACKTGDKVTIGWLYDERMRVTSIEHLNEDAKAVEER